MFTNYPKPFDNQSILPMETNMKTEKSTIIYTNVKHMFTLKRPQNGQ